jgi:dimeric dUTPase (all-alpha-NTP-PPase superfamily)
MSVVNSARLETQLKAMAMLQDAYNVRVHPEWRNQGFAFYRAIWTECAELLDHFGWKWWKHQETDLAQVKLEIVDIWHFGLSELMRTNVVAADRVDASVTRTFVERGEVKLASDFREAVETLAERTLYRQAFPLEAFVDLMVALPISFDELYRTYVGKNVLNTFRLAHGYKTGGYRKLWAGREDNDHLVELASGLDSGEPAYADKLYGALVTRYRETA